MGEEASGERWAPPDQGPAVAAHFGRVSEAELQHIGTLGKGQFGRVSLVAQGGSAGDGEVFALRTSSKEHLATTGMTDSQQRSEDLWKRFASPFVQRLYATWEDGESFYAVVEPCVGGDLYQANGLRKLFGQRPAAAFYAAAAAEGVAYLHDCGVVYRDLKPENLLLRHDGTVCLGDFGLVKQILGAKTKTVCGTPEYMAPEVIQSGPAAAGYDYAVDWWCLGILIHELLAGQTPFAAPSPWTIYRAINKGDWKGLAASLAPEEAALVRALCAKVPSERLPMQPAGRAQLRRAGFFAPVDWAQLREGTARAPFRPFGEACEKLRAAEEKRAEAKKEE